MQPAEVAHALEALGQDVLQEAAQKLVGGQPAGFAQSGAALGVGEGDVGAVVGQQTGIGKRGALHVAGQITEGGVAGAGRLAVDDPLALPEAGGQRVKQSGRLGLERDLEPLTEAAREDLDAQQEGLALLGVAVFAPLQEHCPNWSTKNAFKPAATPRSVLAAKRRYLR